MGLYLYKASSFGFFFFFLQWPSLQVFAMEDISYRYHFHYIVQSQIKDDHRKEIVFLFSHFD